MALHHPPWRPMAHNGMKLNGSGRKKQAILQAAERIMAQKGTSATISEIAGHAGVTDSIIYHYYKNKEDLLFSVAEERLRQGHQALLAHQRGLADPIARLRNLIWFSLHYNEAHPDFSRLILFECRSNRNFLTHPAFRYVRRYQGAMRGILEDGIRDGLFREDLHVPVVRDAVNGLLDIQCIQRLIEGNRGPLDREVEEIMNMVLPMIARDATSPADTPDKPDRILAAAEQAFSRHGFEHARMQEIAREAGVAEGTVYEYFGNKEELLFKTLKRRLDTQADRMRELFHITCPVRKLRRFIRHHFYMYLEHQEFAGNFLLNGLFNPNFYTSDVHGLFERYLGTIGRILDEGRQSNRFRQDINNRIFENLFMGAFMLIALRWMFMADDPDINQVKEINQVVDLLTRAAVRDT